MPRDSGGTYTLPAGNPVVDGTVIESVWANSTLNDIALQLNNVLTRDGVLGPNQPVKFIDGSVALPGIAFAAQPGSGIYRAAPSTVGLSVAGVSRQTWAPALTSIVGDFAVGGNLAVAGTTAFTGAITLPVGASGTMNGTLVCTAPEVLQITNAAGAIVWRVPSTQNPPGVVLQRTGTDGLYVSAGVSGIVFNNPNGNLEYVSNYLRPSSNAVLDLGDPTHQFKNFYCQAIGVSGGITATSATINGSVGVSGSVTLSGTLSAGTLSTTGDVFCSSLYSGGGPIFGAAQQIIGNIAGTVLFGIAGQSGIGGKMILVRGADISGFAFCAAYLAATTVSGGGGAVVTIAGLGRAGSASPVLTFGSSGNSVTLSVSAGGNLTYVSVVG